MHNSNCSNVYPFDGVLEASLDDFVAALRIRRTQAIKPANPDVECQRAEGDDEDETSVGEFYRWKNVGDAGNELIDWLGQSVRGEDK